MVTLRQVGGYVASEGSTLAYKRTYRANSAKRPVIYFTGGPGDDRDFLTATASGSQITPVLSETGTVFVSAAFGGANQWGNDTTQTRIGQLWTYVKAQAGTKTDKFVGIGVSKGATALLNYTRNNPGNVAALVLIVPAVNVSDIYDNNRSGLAAGIDAAYGGSWAANKATHDPALNASTHASQAIPMKLIPGTTDTTVLASVVSAFGSTVGATVQGVTGTDHLTTAPALNPVADVWGFLAAYV